jgi:hypothetical protein
LVSIHIRVLPILTCTRRNRRGFSPEALQAHQALQALPQNRGELIGVAAQRVQKRRLGLRDAFQFEIGANCLGC